MIKNIVYENVKFLLTYVLATDSTVDLKMINKLGWKMSKEILFVLSKLLNHYSISQNFQILSNQKYFWCKNWNVIANQKSVMKQSQVQFFAWIILKMAKFEAW